MMNRRTAREKALQALFQIDVSQADPQDAIQHVLEEEQNDTFLSQLVEGVVHHKDEIDQLIVAHLEKWSLERLANVDRNLLRMAVFELKYLPDVPPKVVMNEAIEIAKRFSDDQSSRFVNGVLSKINEKLNK